MQFGGAPADLPHALEQGCGLGGFRHRLGRQHAVVVDETIERCARHRPGVALVLDKLMDNGERAALVALHQFDRPEQPRRVLEQRLVGEEAADFDFRMGAGGDPAQDFDDITVVDNDAAVRLLAVDGIDILELRERIFGEDLGRPEFERLVVANEIGARLDLGQ